MLGELDQERDQITKDLFDKFFSNPSGLITSAVRIGALRLSIAMKRLRLRARIC